MFIDSELLERALAALPLVAWNSWALVEIAEFLMNYMEQAE